MKKYFLETIVFLGGAAVMIFELVGGRVLAPFVGTSIFIWSSLIGVILAALNGYFEHLRKGEIKIECPF